ncbi:MAG: UDP-N-acetylglucosamine 2-epimerase (non-hydrolyzing), partial [Flavobacteriales bacterium]|nr:UDP-N-acetylglucosamine 2-epimerase (non-hydrolyzing) [Flavobacteriales bacterium]
MKKILISVGTRPNFIKVTQFKRIAEQMGNCEVKIVHTGQHYDRFMSGVFFDQFNLHPDYFLALETRKTAEQLGEMTMKLADLMASYKPDLVVVPGNVNSTLAAALAAKKSGIQVAHLESGLRSFDPHSPEENNRIMIDQLSDLYFITEENGVKNLESEGKSPTAMHFVGNTMIDTLVAFKDEIEASTILDQHNLSAKAYSLMT